MRRISKWIKRLIVLGFLLMASLFVKDYLNNNFAIFASDYHSPYVYLMKRENKEALIKENHKARAYPASLTKVLTTLVALEHIDDLSAIAPVDTESYQEMVAKNSSMAGFYGREPTTYRDLLYGTILSSGGEAANSLAIHLAGDQEQFVEMMNEKAKEIGLERSHFTNPEGMHDKNQYTTAHDMAKLLDVALEDGDFRAIFTKPTFQTSATLDHPEGILLQSTVLSKLENVSQNGFEIIGGKSGTTLKAGQSWLTLGVKDGQEYIAVAMGAPFDDMNNRNDQQIEDTIKLFETIE